MLRDSIAARLIAPLVFVLAACVGDGTASDVAAQTAAPPLPAPLSRIPASQLSRTIQRIGEAEITITYSRPVARGRELFGDLVPWDEMWAPGADHASYLTTSADIELGGQPLPAGSYSIWLRPGPGSFEFVFHREWDVFHMPYPGDDGVALRLEVPTTTATHMETMAFYFPVADRRDGALAFHWGETRAEIPIHVPEP